MSMSMSMKTRMRNDRDSRPLDHRHAGRSSQCEAPAARASVLRANDGSTRIRRVATGCLLAVAGCLLVTSSASALYVDTSAPVGSSSSVALRIGDHSISVLDEIKTIEVRSDEHGIRLRFKVAFRTIDFDDGPVLLDRVDFEAGAGRAVATSAHDGPLIVTGDRSVNRMVSQLRVAGRSNVLAARGIHVDIQRPIATTAPVPEPGAALLFAAGLLAIGVGTRQRG